MYQLFGPPEFVVLGCISGQPLLGLGGDPILTFSITGRRVCIEIRIRGTICALSQSLQNCRRQIKEMDFLCSIQVLTYLGTVVVSVRLRLWPFDEIDVRILCSISGPLGQALGAEGVLPSRQIESFLRVFKQFAHTLPSRQVVG